MSSLPCSQCKLRAKYDRAPQSLLGRVWRWHIRICPGWRAYLRSLNAEERDQVEKTYALGAYARHSTDGAARG